MKKVFVTRDILPDGINLLRKKGFEVSVWEHDRPMNADELHQKAQKVDALICTLSDSINKNFLEKNSHLKAITNYAVGLNNIDLVTAKKLNIKIGNTPDVLTEATAEIAMGLMIGSARLFKGALKNAEFGGWKYFEPKGFLGMSLHKKTLGILGAGRIGKRMGEMAQGAFQMQVKYFKRGEDLQNFLSDLDVLSLHVPLTDETKNIIGEKELKAMKKSAILINTARGEVVDQEALYKALKNHELFSAGLDVTTPEPLPIDHPLFKMNNVLILPHIGSATMEARSAMSIICAENLLRDLV